MLLQYRSAFQSFNLIGWVGLGLIRLICTLLTSGWLPRTMRALADYNYVNYLKSTSSKTDQEQAKTLSGAEQLDTKPEW